MKNDTFTIEETKQTGTLLAICTSPARGTEKQPVPQAELVENFGIQGDAHAGDWHRQVSLLSAEKVREFQERGAQVSPGAFGENLLIEGFDFKTLPVGTRFQIGEALLALTQRGKECHTHCRIYHTMGDCIMPREGVFARVLKSGHIQEGDDVFMLAPKKNAPYTAAVITLSDKGAAGEREDKSGPLAAALLTEAGYDVQETVLLPDEKEQLMKELIRLSDGRQINLICTTGGTGFSPRDITPEATTAVCERMAPGLSEALRAYSMTITPRAMLSRGVAGLRGQSLILNLPGSPKAVREELNYILPHLTHGLDILTGRDGDCAK